MIFYYIYYYIITVPYNEEWFIELIKWATNLIVLSVLYFIAFFPNKQGKAAIFRHAKWRVTAIFSQYLYYTVYIQAPPVVRACHQQPVFI